jgi:hypothetical protein
LVEDICMDDEFRIKSQSGVDANPLFAHLVAGGASTGAVTRLLTRFASETGLALDDRPGALAWMTGQLATGERAPTEWTGHHVFLGEHGNDRLEPVLDLASCLTDHGRRVLTVAVLPDHDRDEQRLVKRASASGHDAAVIRDISQLSDLEDHLKDFDHVLLDLPGLSDCQMETGGPIHHWVADRVQFNRHLTIPLDRDFKDLQDLRQAARDWNCDWLALTRGDVTRRKAKILDLIEAVPLPISFIIGNSGDRSRVAGATSESVLDTILATGSSFGFRPGLAIQSD